uniref:Aminoacyl-transfer RNA synthetases class-II family profile domain-containing protein n=1 Tax=Panagrolaimus davidi TaxID=227884 RepID=A0A914R0N3_9BILA
MLNRLSKSYLTLRQLSSNAFSLRTHNCGELRKADIGRKVELYGWVLKNRFNGSFIVLHDKYGFIQARLPQESKLKNIAASAKIEDVLKIIGTVQSRGENVNPEMGTGDVEVEIESLEVLNKCSTIPFPVIGNLKPDAETDVELRKRLIYRYFDLRKTEAQRLLHLRANVIKKIRRSLEDSLGFIEVETPTLAAHTPGGAAEFIVPTQMHGQVYCLPQSPQIYKQLLMIGQVDRYYQIARCYRDEAIRGDRQPEFTQVDIELSFVTQDQVLSLLEKMIIDSWPETLASHRPSAPFQRLTFDEAMKKYGVQMHLIIH